MACVTVGFTFHLDLAHSAVHEPSGHTNSRVHGHSYRVALIFQGAPDHVSGYAVDLGEVQQIIADIKASADGRLMNEIPGMGYSMETLAAWIAARTSPMTSAKLASVEIHRDAIGMFCRYVL